jgi:sporulation protein YlmC with PRC-barrel domain
MSKAIILAAALVLVPLPAFCQGTQSNKSGEPSSSTTVGGAATDRGEMEELLDRLSQSQLKDRLTAAVERVRDACAADIEELCGSVAPGEGRIAECVLDNADDLSRRCRLTLFRVSRNLRRVVANFADECANAIRTQCENAEKVGECAEQKSATISPACHTMVTTLRHASQQLSNLTGVTVLSSDGKDVGRVVEVVRGPDGKIQSVQIQVGRFLGLGDKVISMNADKLQELGERIKLKLGADQVMSEARK